MSFRHRDFQEVGLEVVVVGDGEECGFGDMPRLVELMGLEVMGGDGVGDVRDRGCHVVLLARVDEPCPAIGPQLVEWTSPHQPQRGGEVLGAVDNMRIIVRRERPRPGAQLRFDDVDGYRLTGSVTNTTRGQLADLEVRHRCRARCEDRIRNAKDSGLANLPLHGFDQNRIWCQIVALAGEITAWMGLLAHPDHQARRWEPERLR